ncbi:MAG: hypothetical protein AAFP15_12235 [Bacteroidota bacterium]
MGKDGRPVALDCSASVTYQIFDAREHVDDDAREIASGEATRDPFWSALHGASGRDQADPQRLRVAADGAIVGRPYMLKRDGQQEVVVLRDIGYDAAYTETSLRYAWPADGLSELHGLEWIATMPDIASITGDDPVQNGGGPYLIVWSWVDTDGNTVRQPDQIYLDRYSLRPPIDESFVLMADPNIAERLRRRATPSQAIAVAFQEAVAEIEQAGKDPTLLMPSSTFQVALRHQALYYAYTWVAGTDLDVSAAELHHRRYEEAMRHILIGEPPKHTVEIDRDTDVAKKPTAGFEILLRS